MPRSPAPPWFFPGQEVLETATDIQWTIMTVMLDPPGATEVTAILMNDDYNVVNIALSAFQARFTPILEEGSPRLPYYGIYSSAELVPRVTLVQVFREGDGWRDVRFVGSSREERVRGGPRLQFVPLPVVYHIEVRGLGRSFSPGDIFLYPPNEENQAAIGVIDGINDEGSVVVATEDSLIPTRRILASAQYHSNGANVGDIGEPIPDPATPPTLPSPAPPRKPRKPFLAPIERRSTFDRLTGDDDL